jgi:hypothetical protein
MSWSPPPILKQVVATKSIDELRSDDVPANLLCSFRMSAPSLDRCRYCPFLDIRRTWKIAKDSDRSDPRGRGLPTAAGSQGIVIAKCHRLRIAGLPVRDSRHGWRLVWVAAALIALGNAATASDESREDAWWTGPINASSAAMLPQGHILVEPYLYDVITDGRFDANGRRQATANEHDLGSLTYLLYGLSDRITVGLIPRFGVNQPARQPNDAGVGDTTLEAGYGLTQYQDGRWMPQISVVLDETVPTGRYDRLARASEGFGAGSFTTALSVYSQDYFWMPNGRILRARLDLTYAVSTAVDVRDQSVYGTASGFRGDAYPGDSFTADAAAEYSLTRSWVLALDAIYQHGASTRVSCRMAAQTTGAFTMPSFQVKSRSSDLIGFAPAIEYNWNGSVGVLVGVRIFEIGRNVTASVTPVIALNLAL